MKIFTKATAAPPETDEIEEFCGSLINLIEKGGRESDGNKFIEKGIAIAIGTTVGCLISLAYNRKSLTRRVEELERRVDENKK